MKEKFRDKNFTAEQLVILTQCNGYIDRTRRAGYMVTLRQVYYFTISKDILPTSWIDEDYNLKQGLSPDTKNTLKNYKRLGELLNDARYAGLVDWDAMEDRTRNLESVSHWSNPESIMESCADSYRNDKWENQPKRVEVWVEKDALVGVLEKVCRELDVPWFSCRGYTSSSELYSAGKRMRKYKQWGQEPVIIYLGDHDPSGVDMTRDIHERVRLLGRTDIEMRRIALTMDQIEELSPPPNPAKLTDSRAKKYIDAYGDDSWELDALPIEYIDRIISETVMEYRDEDAWAEAVQDERKDRRLMRLASRRWADVVQFLDDTSDKNVEEEDDEE